MVKFSKAQGKQKALRFLRFSAKERHARTPRPAVGPEYAALLRPALLLSLAFFPLFFPACIFFSSVRLPLKLFVDAAAAALITRSLAPLLHRFLPHLRPGPLAMLPVAVFLIVPTLHYAFFCILSWMFPTMDVWNQ